MCHGVCQVLVHFEGDRIVRISGDPESPTSKGYLCPKGAASPELLYHPDRLTHPLRKVVHRGENRWQRISWDEALDEMAGKLEAIKRDSGSEYFAMMQGTGRPYTGFTARFANAFGTPNFTGSTHICYFPRVLASIFTLGQLPICDVYGFGGVQPECVVLWGCNVTYSGASDGMCGGMVQRAIKRASKVIVVDPRRIGPAETAHHWLQVRPGTDGALALAMLNVIVSDNLVDHDFVDNYTVGFDLLVEHVRPFTPEWAANITGLTTDEIRSATHTLATTRPACIQWGMALDTSPCSFHTARSLLILRALTGSIDTPGGDVLWVPPEKVRQKSPFMNPEVIGGHFLPAEKRQRVLDGGRFPINPMVHPPTFWKSVVNADPYRVKAMWIVGSNPLLTMTHSLEVEQALKLIEFVVVSDFFLTPTAQIADLVLPAAMWLEQDDVVNLHKIWCVLARKKLAQVGETRDDREVIIQLARRLGLEQAFPWENLRAYLEWLLQDTGKTFDEFCEQGIITGKMRYKKYQEEGFHTLSKKFEIYSATLESMGVSPLPIYREPPLSPLSAPEVAGHYPLILTNSGKIKEFFHSEGRQISSLRKANPYPLVEIHPRTAESLSIRDGDHVWIETPEGRVKMRARIFDGIAPGVVAAQFGWWFPEETAPEYGWKKSSVNLLYGDTQYDPETGSEPLHSILCKVYPVAANELLCGSI